MLVLNTDSLKIVRNHKSGAGKIRHHFNVIGYYTPGSLADYILLKQYYSDLEKEESDWKARVEFNELFLHKHKDHFGNLQCSYCGRDDLKIYSYKIDHKNPNDIATADHFWPSSLFPQYLFDHNDLVVSCRKCNSTKKAKLYSLDTLKYYRPLPDQILPGTQKLEVA